MNAVGCLLEAGGGKPAVGDRGEEGAMDPPDSLLVQVVADAERVGAGRDRTNGRLLDAHQVGDGAHLEGIADHESVVPELAAQESGDDRPAERRRLGVQSGNDEVRRHDRADARVDRGAEGHQRRLPVARGDRQRQVRVDGRVAVAGEVLGAGDDTLRLRAADERRDVAGDQLRIGAERADADHGVVGVRVHVGDRREVQADAAVGQIGGNPAGDGFGQLDVVDDAEREVAGVRAAVLPLEPGDVAALLVDREQQARQRRRQRAQLVGVADVVREERQPAEAALGEAQNPVGRLVTREARQQAGRRQPVELAASRHPLTAPAVSPNAIFRCTIRKKMTTGIAVSVDAAISAPQSVWRLVPRK